jgi:hypothetical protein
MELGQKRRCDHQIIQSFTENSTVADIRKAKKNKERIADYLYGMSGVQMIVKNA